MNKPKIAQNLITPEELPKWVPGRALSKGSGPGWSDIGQITYEFQGQSVPIPGMDRFLLVQYLQGQTPMERKFGSRLTRTHCAPGDFTLQTFGEDSHWNWQENIVVSHIYLKDEMMRKLASEIEGREVGEIALHDVLRGQDDVVRHIAGQITQEAAKGGHGSSIYVEALSVQLAVHLLRNYATCNFKQRNCPGMLTRADMKLLREYVEAHLDESLTLEQLANLFNMGVWTFNRYLKRTIDQSAYSFVQDCRLQRASQLIRNSNMPLKCIATQCGFSDQPHLTRAFRARYGVTPANYRRQTL
ncbi:MAG: AraC family transcriptional regulator [Porticoccaceae bacterium]